MSLFRKLCSVAMVLGVTVFGAASCGTTSNNDQGTSFLALGYYTFKEDSTDEVIPISGANILLGADRPQIVTSNGVFGDGDELRVLIGLQNRLSTQFIRVQRTDCSYEVQGADAGLQIPDEAIPSSFVIGHADTSATGDAGAGTSTDEPVLPTVIYKNVDVITPDVFAFLNVNRNKLPELPFAMTIECTSTGITQAGDVLTTNPIFLEVNFFDTAECCTGTGAEGAGGFQGGTGTGGDPDTFSGNSEADTSSSISSDSESE